MIAICSNPYRDLNYEISNQISAMLTEAGYTVLQTGVFNGEEKALADYQDQLELVIVVGGDGTILRVANELTGTDIPIVGVNLGTMGFMASVERDHLETLLGIARGECRRVIHSMIDVELFREGEVVYRGRALNDAVIHGSGYTIGLDAYADGALFTSVLGDGIIVSTPTGSTGYGMSAGGPIMEPENDALLVCPICAHTLSSRPFVLSSKRTITVTTNRIHDRQAFLSVDGNRVSTILKGDLLSVKKSENRIIMVSDPSHNFLSTVIHKLV